MTPQTHSHRGFTLVEILVVITILGILAAISLPAYQNHILRSHRIEAQALIMQEAQRQENLKTHSGSYVARTFNSPSGSTAANRYYEIKVEVPASGSYTLTATPSARQPDRLCQILSQDAWGRRSVTGTGSLKDCWPS